MAERYRAEVIPTKARSTQQMHHIYLNYLLQFFDDPPAPFEAIRPVDIRKYLDWRPFKVSANREISVFSHIWNWARSKGITDLANPCAGIRRNKESGRDVYIDDATYRAVYQAADQTLRDAMDLAYLTGQRVSDVLSMDERHIVNGALEICQAKTGAKLAIAITGELAVLIKRIFDHKRGLKLRSTRLIVDEKGFGLKLDGASATGLGRRVLPQGSPSRHSNSVIYAPKRRPIRRIWRAIYAKRKRSWAMRRW